MGIDLSCSTVYPSIHLILRVAKSLSVCPCVGVRLFSDMIDNDITEPVSVAGYTLRHVSIFNILHAADQSSLRSSHRQFLTPFPVPYTPKYCCRCLRVLTALCG